MVTIPLWVLITLSVLAFPCVAILAYLSLSIIFIIFCGILALLQLFIDFLAKK